MRILVIEDDPRQASWALKSLSGHNVTLASSGVELARYDLRDFEVVLTDLFFPDLDGEMGPTGARVIQECLDIIDKGQGSLRGVGLVSNYEHHVNWTKTYETEGDGAAQEEEEVISAGVKKVPLDKGLKYGGPSIKLGEKSVFVYTHDLYLRHNPHFLSPDGRVVRFEDTEWAGQDGAIEAVAFRGWLNLKPWVEVLECIAL